MARVELIDRRDGLAPEQARLFDWIVESRGELVRPFQVLLHAPEQAEHIARLGHVVRFESGLAGDDRELAILATGRAHGCDYVWDTHVALAQREGTSLDEIAHLDGETGATGDLAPREAAILDMVGELCSGSSLSASTFARVESHLGTKGVVELSVLVGYYTMLGYAMASFDACSTPGGG